MLKNTSIDSLLNRVSVDIDLEIVTVDDINYENVLQRPKSELSQWLYCVLHTGNSNLLTPHTARNDLQPIIADSIQDHTILVPSTNFAIDNVTYSEVGGVRINKQSVNNKLELSSKRPNLTPGFYMFVATNNLSTIRYYVGTDNPEDAIKIWSATIDKLLKDNVEFSGKVLSSTESYPRNDSVVFYSDVNNSEMVQMALLDVIQDVNPLHTGLVPSPFTKVLYDSLSTAEQPLDSKGIRQSLGEQRTEILAESILDTFTTGLDFEKLLTKRLEIAKVDISDLSKNRY